jgi:ketosteroid isomerase-like protein
VTEYVPFDAGEEDDMATAEAEIEALEHRFWKALQDHDPDASVALCDFPLLLTGAQGASTIDEDLFVKLSREATWDIQSFDLSKVQVRIVGDTAMVAYHVHEDLTVEDGEPVSFDAADSSVWIKRGGRWKCAMHTEALLGDPYGRDRTKKES